MDVSHLLGVGIALASALAWGAGDFSGGVASRGADQFQVLGLAALSGLLLLTTFALIGAESWPTTADGAWAVVGGAAGALGLAALYRGLSRGRTASFAPVVAVVGAAVPVLVGAVTAGPPAVTVRVGLALALVGIWRVSQASEAIALEARGDLPLAVTAGAAFGGFFLAIARIEGAGMFGPLALARVGTLAVALVTLIGRRAPWPRLTRHPIALAAGALDAGGNVLYLAATRYTRIEVAAVLGSLYPAVTVLLASMLLAEDVTRPQWEGIGLCLAAVGLIVL